MLTITTNISKNDIVEYIIKKRNVKLSGVLGHSIEDSKINDK